MLNAKYYEPYLYTGILEDREEAELKILHLEVKANKTEVNKKVASDTLAISVKNDVTEPGKTRWQNPKGGACDYSNIAGKIWSRVAERKGYQVKSGDSIKKMGIFPMQSFKNAAIAPGTFRVRFPEMLRSFILV